MEQRELLSLLAMAAHNVYELALASGNDELVKAVTSIEVDDVVLNVTAVAAGQPPEKAIGLWKSRMYDWNDHERAEVVVLPGGRWDVWPSSVLAKIPRWPLLRAAGVMP